MCYQSQPFIVTRCSTATSNGQLPGSRSDHGRSFRRAPFLLWRVLRLERSERLVTSEIGGRNRLADAIAEAFEHAIPLQMRGARNWAPLSVVSWRFVSSRL